jgi:hypothetical protein
VLVVQEFVKTNRQQAQYCAATRLHPRWIHLWYFKQAQIRIEGFANLVDIPTTMQVGHIVDVRYSSTNRTKYPLSWAYEFVEKKANWLVLALILLSFIAPLFPIISNFFLPKRVSITTRPASCISFWTPGHRPSLCLVRRCPYLHSSSRGFSPQFYCNLDTGLFSGGLCFRFSVMPCCFSHSTVLSHLGFHIFSRPEFTMNRQKRQPTYSTTLCDISLKTLTHSVMGAFGTSPLSMWQTVHFSPPVCSSSLWVGRIFYSREQTRMPDRDHMGLSEW